MHSSLVLSPCSFVPESSDFLPLSPSRSLSLPHTHRHKHTHAHKQTQSGPQMAWWCQGERGLLGSKSSSVWPLHPSLAFFFSVCHFIPPLPLLSILLPPPFSLASSLFIFSPNLSIRSVDKLFMPLSVPEALSPLPCSPAP